MISTESSNKKDKTFSQEKIKPNDSKDQKNIKKRR